MTLRGILAYAAAAAFWAVFFIALAAGATVLGVSVAAAIFGLICAGALALMARMVGRRFDWRLNWSLVAMWACLGVTILVAAGSSAAQVGVAVTAIVVSSIPLFDTMVSQMRGAERVTGVGALSLLLGIIGLILVAILPAGDRSWGFLGGVLASLVAAVAAGSCGRQIAGQLSRPRALETAIMAALVGGVGSLFLIPFALPTSFAMGPVVVWALVAVGCAFLALFAFSRASEDVSRRVGATLPGVGTIVAVLAGVVVLHESLSVGQAIGMVLILIATAMLRGLVPRWFPRSWRV